MTIQQARYDRRRILYATGVTLFTGTTLAGCLDEEDTDDEQFVEDEPDYGGWFDDVDNYEGTVDLRGEDEVEVEVGAGDDGLLFEPPAILIDAGPIDKIRRTSTRYRPFVALQMGNDRVQAR